MARQRPAAFDLAEYGVQVKPEPRLIVMMAALEAAGFDPTSKGGSPSAFRAQVRRDQSGLDPDLRARLQGYYDHRKLPAPATPAEQAARYVSLAYALGPAPGFESPEMSEDLPAGVLDVIDFAPLLREFYRKSGMDDRLPTYLRAYAAEGDRLVKGSAQRLPIAEDIRAALSYLHTRPSLVSVERIVVKNPASSQKKKTAMQSTTTVREHDRHFIIVPDLLAAPGAINFRVIADDYYLIVPAGADPAAELRRAYLQFVVDPLVARFSRQIIERRPAIKQLLDERSKAGTTVTPDIFLTVSRSLVAAADARLEEVARLEALTRETRLRLEKTTNAGERAALTKSLADARTALADEEAAQLADAYESGAVLSFFFADQLRGLESSGFDIGNFFGDMIAAIDPAKEGRRLEEYAAARQRGLAARQARLARTAVPETPESTGEASPRSTLVKNLIEIDELVQGKNYEAADARLRALLQEYPGEPRILFAMGETANLSAADAVDEDVQSERLNRALANYRSAIQASTADTNPAVLSRSHEAMGAILEFLGRTDEAMKELDAAIKIGDVPGGGYRAAVERKQKLTQKP